jgi:cell division GTPase FtsZ
MFERSCQEGMALMGTGIAEGENRASEAAQRVISPAAGRDIHSRSAGAHNITAKA